MHRDPTQFRNRFKMWKEGKDVYEAGLPKFYEGEDAEQSAPNIFQRPDGTFFYSNKISGEEVDVTPINKTFSDNPSMWTFTDNAGRTYTPTTAPKQSQGEVLPYNKSAGERFWDNYVGELKYNLQNRKVIGGKYTLPAIGLGALGGYLAGAAGGATAMPGYAEAASLIGKNIYSDAFKKFAVSMLTGETINEASKLFTGNSWGQNISNLSEGWVPETVGSFTNPGYLYGGQMPAEMVNNKAWKIFENAENNLFQLSKKAYKQVFAKRRIRNLFDEETNHSREQFQRIGDEISNAKTEDEVATAKRFALEETLDKKRSNIFNSIDNGAEKLRANREPTQADILTKVLTNAQARRLRPEVAKIMSERIVEHPEFIKPLKKNKAAEDALRLISEGVDVDFSKMSAEDIMRFLKTNARGFDFTREGSAISKDKVKNLPDTAEGLFELMRKIGVEFDKNGRVVDRQNVIPFNKIFTSGQFKIPIFGTNDIAEGQISISNPGLEAATVLSDLIKSFSDTTIKPRRQINQALSYSANVPDSYTNALKQNMEYLQRRFPGAKPFGSATTSAQAGTPHSTHDIDLLISEEDFIKNVESQLGGRTNSGWNVSSKYRGDGFEDTYMHSIDQSLGDAGNIDFNIVYSDPLTGMASAERGTRALELFRQFFPVDYKQAVQESFASGNPIKINKTAKELIDAYDPVKKTILDALSSNKEKHISRAEAHLTTSDPDAVEGALDLFLREKTGGSGTHLPLTRNMFTDVERNRRIFDELGYAGVDKETVVNDPAKMKNLVDYWYIHNGVFARGVSTDQLIMPPGTSKLQALDSAYRIWKSVGGNANGAGLNTSTLGDTKYGDVYGYIQPKLKFDQVSDPEQIIQSAKRQLGHYSYKFTPEEKQQIRDIYKKYGFDIYGADFDTPGEFLSRTPSGIDVAEALQEISDILGIRALSKQSTFGQGRYNSMTGRVGEEDAVMFDLRHGAEIPVSDIKRDAITVRNSVNSSNKIKEGFEDVQKLRSSRVKTQRLLQTPFAKSARDQQERYNMYMQLRQRIGERKLQTDHSQLIRDVEEAKKYSKITQQQYEDLKENLRVAKNTHYNRQRMFNRKQRQVEDNILHLTMGLGGVGLVGTGGLLVYDRHRRTRQSVKPRNTKTHQNGIAK